MSLPVELRASVQNKSGLYEQFEKFGQLKEFAVLVPTAHCVDFSIKQQETVIMYLDPVFSEFFDGSLSAEARLKVLFGIKEKWTIGEL